MKKQPFNKDVFIERLFEPALAQQETVTEKIPPLQATELTQPERPEQALPVHVSVNTPPTHEAHDMFLGFMAGIAQSRHTPGNRRYMHAGEKRGIRSAFVVCGVAGIAAAGAYFLPDIYETYTNKQQAIELQETSTGGGPIVPKRIAGEGSSPEVVQQITGTAPVIQQTESNAFTYGNTMLSWQVVTMVPQTNSYQIELSVVAASGGVEPDARLAERFASGDITDQELALFLVQNNIVVPAIGSGAFVEIVGKTIADGGDPTLLKTLELLA
jgi:hypothetical protein